MVIKTAKELAAAAEAVAKNYKTLYVMGCIGSPMTEKNKQRYINQDAYNRKPEPKKAIMAAGADVFGFDCICFIKSLLWGWNGNPNAIYGGASYESNGVPDITTEDMMGRCTDASEDFSNVAVGEYLWMKGHCGIYVGNGLAVECTPKWNNCVQITAVHNIGAKDGYNSRTWAKHGKLPYVAYIEESAPASNKCTVQLPILRSGDSGDAVKAMQTLLIGYKYSCGAYGADSKFGYATEYAVRRYQRENGLDNDGICGPATWNKLLGV